MATVWQFQAQGGWENYDENLANLLEKAFQAGKSELKVKRIHCREPFFYHIDLNRFYQLNEHSRKLRLIRRISPSSGGESTNSTTKMMEEAGQLTQWKIIHSQQDLPQGDRDCPVCLCSFIDEQEPSQFPKLVMLPECKHVFHVECITRCYTPYPSTQSKEAPSNALGFLECPICRHLYGVRFGNQPMGFMKVTEVNGKWVEGGENQGKGLIVIDYTIPDGIQSAEHPAPGCRYSGTVRRAYLPNTTEGQAILKKLKIAFERRLTFTIGTSVTSGLSNQVVWNGIHHKTKTSGGSTAFGYPDPTYFERVSKELADKGIRD